MKSSRGKTVKEEVKGKEHPHRVVGLQRAVVCHLPTEIVPLLILFFLWIRSYSHWGDEVMGKWGESWEKNGISKGGGCMKPYKRPALSTSEGGAAMEMPPLTTRWYLIRSSTFSIKKQTFLSLRVEFSIRLMEESGLLYYATTCLLFLQ